MNEEEIERIVESSKRMQAIAEFTTAQSTDELLDLLSKAVMLLAMAMRDETELDTVEIASAITGSVSGIMVAWVLSGT